MYSSKGWCPFAKDVELGLSPKKTHISLNFEFIISLNFDLILNYLSILFSLTSFHLLIFNLICNALIPLPIYSNHSHP
jgi:hypothetical protein